MVGPLLLHESIKVSDWKVSMVRNLVTLLLPTSSVATKALWIMVQILTEGLTTYQCASYMFKETPSGKEYIDGDSGLSFTVFT